MAYSTCHPVDSYSSEGSVYCTSVVERLTRSVPPTLPFAAGLALWAGPATAAATSSIEPATARIAETTMRVGECDLPSIGLLSGPRSGPHVDE